MERRRLKAGFLAGVLALTMGVTGKTALANSSTPVKGEKQIVQTETEVELIDMFKTDYEILDLDYWEFYEYKYVSEDGKIEKWYCSSSPEPIDGLKKTSEKRMLEFWNYDEEKECDIEEEHAHLYMDPSTGLFIPAFNEKLVDDRGWYKLRAIVKLPRETAQILNDYNVGRLSDNIVTMPVAVENSKMNGRLGVIYLIPKKINNDKMELEIVFNDGSIDSYSENMNGYLISNGDTFYAGTEFDPERDKILILDKNK